MARPAEAPQSPGPEARAGRQLLEELSGVLRRAGDLARDLGAQLETAPAAPQDSSAEEDLREVSERLVASEHHVRRLMNLYVATYQLHGSLDPDVVCRTIAEIAVNLLGAESFVLLLRRENGVGHEVALREGALPSWAAVFAPAVYLGGERLVDRTLVDGTLRLGPTEDSEVLAAVPLRMEEAVVGTLVVLKLLAHKPVWKGDDRELLDLLSAHAASALCAARIFVSKDRRLNSLESLFRLARGD
jgi:nitrate/nitrite-specific signal transduction histidine kinase